MLKHPLSGRFRCVKGLRATLWIGGWGMLVLTSAVVFAAAPSRAGRTSDNLVPVTVQLNWRHQFEFAAFYAAQVRGYYREAGLDVRLIEGGPDIDAVGAVLAGRADFGVANSGLMITRFEGKPVVVLGAIMQHSAISLLASRDRGIDNVLDLDGRTIHCPPHAREEINAYLAASGLDLSRVQYAGARSAVGPERLEHVDATEVYTTNDGFRVMGQEHRYVLFVPRSAGIDLYGDVLFTLEHTLAHRRGLCERFREATFRGLRESMDHPDEFIDFILATCNTQGKSREHLAYEADKLRQMIRADLVEPGYMSIARWRHVRDMFASVGRLPADYEFAGFLDMPVRRGLPAWVPWLLAMLAVGLVVAVIGIIKVQTMNRRLQHEVARRIRGEQELRDGERRYRRLVETASSVLTHDVHTPLTVMRLQMRTLRMKYPGLAQTVRSHLDALTTAMGRLEELFDRNLAAVFRADDGSSRRTADVAAVIDTTIRDFQLMRESECVRRRDLPTGVCCEMAAGTIRTILFNLLDNARKYGEGAVPIEVGLSTNADGIAITVGNRWRVPPPVDPEELFGQGERGHAGDETPGSGLGLHLVRLLAEAHGGKVGIVVDGGWFDVVVTVPAPGHSA
jgi:ABC-type nitrate/sulfonate/bicarbonate transport system substrate-binding protein